MEKDKRQKTLTEQRVGPLTDVNVCSMKEKEEMVGA